MSSKYEKDDDQMGFFRRLRQNVVETVRPVPGIMKLGINKPAETSTTSSTPPSLLSAFRQSISSPESSYKQHSSPTTTTTSPEAPAYKIQQFEQILNMDNVDLNALRKLSWNGIPPNFRTMSWQLMLGYLSTNKSRRESALSRKRKEYIDSIELYFDVTEADRATQEGELLRQILVDLPRTSPDTPLFQQAGIQRAM